MKDLLIIMKGDSIKLNWNPDDIRALDLPN